MQKTLNMLSNIFMLSLVLVLWGQDSVRSVRLIELSVPAQEREGGSALLGCQYDTEGEPLYSVKWYKDGHEFYRYVPKNHPQMSAFNRPGVHVDMSRSSNTVVALENLTNDSQGIYSCEVSGEAPNFTTVKSQKRIKIHLLPESGPLVSGIQERYFFDEKVLVNCTSSPSRPTAQLKWLINDQPVPQSYLQGPWERIPAVRSDAVETILQLKFIVEPKHFVDGAMNLKCQATIAPLYQRETKSTHFLALPFTMTEKAASFDVVEDNGYTGNTAGDSSFKDSTTWLFILATFIYNFQIN